MATTPEQYTDQLFAAMDLIGSEIVIPNSPSSKFVSRYITSEGVDDEQWLANLRDNDGLVDIWLLTCSLVAGRSDREREMDPVGTFTKPLTFALDHFYDYRQGLDYTENQSGDKLTTNSEREFLTHLFGVDLALEKKRNCLGQGIQINGWTFRLRIKRFTNASAHWAAGTINLDIQDIFR